MTTIPIEFEPFKNYVDISLENQKNEKWSILAKEILNETEETRENALKSLKEKAKDIKLPPLSQEKLDNFWLLVLRAGGMDPDQACKVFKEYILIMKNYPQYFAASKPPTKMDFIFQQQVIQIFGSF